MTIEITDEMVEQMKDALAELFNQRLGPEDAPYIPSDFNGLAEDELTAVCCGNVRDSRSNMPAHTKPPRRKP